MFSLRIQWLSPAAAQRVVVETPHTCQLRPLTLGAADTEPFLAAPSTASFFTRCVPDFLFGPYRVWPFAQVLAESLLTGGFPNGISSAAP